MMKLVAIISFALLASVAFSAATPAVGSSSGVSVFKGSTVFDVTLDSDSTDWAPGTIPYTGVIFGPGATNATVFAYGVTYAAGSGAAGKITGIVARELNSTAIVSQLTEAKATATDALVLDTAAATGLTLVANIEPVLAVGNGSLAVVTTTYDSTSLKASIVLYLYSETSLTTASTSDTLITIATATNADVTTGSGVAWTSTDYALGNAWFQDGVFYIVYTEIAGSNPTLATAPDVFTETGVYLQGYNLTSKETLTTAVTVATITVSDGTTSPRYKGTTAVYPIGGPSSNAEPSDVYVIYKSSSTEISGVLVTITSSTQSAGSANVIATDQTLDATTETNGITYTPSGVWHTDSDYGALLSTQTEAYGGTTFIASLGLYNASSTAAATVVDSGLSTFTSDTTELFVSSFAYTDGGTGFGIIAIYDTTADSGSVPATVGFSYSTFGATGSPTTSVTSGSLQGSINFFLDSESSLWVGYALADTANYPGVYSGYLAEIAYDVNPTFGNVLASFLAFLTLLLASLFAF